MIEWEKKTHRHTSIEFNAEGQYFNFSIGNDIDIKGSSRMRK